MVARHLARVTAYAKRTTSPALHSANATIMTAATLLTTRQWTMRIKIYDSFRRVKGYKNVKGFCAADFEMYILNYFCIFIVYNMYFECFLRHSSGWVVRYVYICVYHTCVCSECKN